MFCTECHHEIPFEFEDVTVTVVWRDGRISRHCHHVPFDPTDSNIVAILGSKDCFDKWSKRGENKNDQDSV